MMKLRLLSVIIVCILCGQKVYSQNDIPSINPYIDYIVDGMGQTSKEYSGNAPITINFYANTENESGWEEYYEWRFFNEKSTEPYLIRYDKNTNYTFTQSGSHKVVLYASFKKENEVVEYKDNYWLENEPIRINISESKLEMPNAFSPNGDGINDVYRAKKGYQSLIEFHAYVFNRWGQKLFEWTDPSEGWDGTYNGKDVKDGVYFVLVKAKGSDGREYNIKKDVNLLRGFIEGTNIPIN